MLPVVRVGDLDAAGVGLVAVRVEREVVLRADRRARQSAGVQPLAPSSDRRRRRRGAGRAATAVTARERRVRRMRAHDIGGRSGGSELGSTLGAWPSDLGALLDPGYLGDLTGRPHGRGARRCAPSARRSRPACRCCAAWCRGASTSSAWSCTRRAEGGDPADLPDLIARLPEVLSDRTHAPGVGRLPQIMAPGELPAELEAELDAIVGAGHLADLPSVDDDHLRSMADAAGRLRARRCPATARTSSSASTRSRPRSPAGTRPARPSVDSLLQ